MNFRVAPFLFTVFVAAPLGAATFVNLDFDAGVVPDDGSGGLEPFPLWADAVPGWSYNGGSPDGTVINTGPGRVNLPHVGVAPWWQLIGTTGDFAMNLKNGYLTDDSGDPVSPYLNAFVSQMATVPADAHRIRLEASGMFEVNLGGTTIAMSEVTPGVYEGIVAPFAGLESELRIINAHSSSEPYSPTIVVDNIRFLAVPEPGVSALAAAVALVGFAGMRRFRGPVQSSRGEA